MSGGESYTEVNYRVILKTTLFKIYSAVKLQRKVMKGIF